MIVFIDHKLHELILVYLELFDPVLKLLLPQKQPHQRLLSIFEVYVPFTIQ